jgi:hypothetical protein
MDPAEFDYTSERGLGRLPWHKPEVQRLTVSLDTRDGQGSQQDSYVFTGDPR